MADNQPRPDRPPPPPRPPEQSSKPTPEFQQKLDVFRAQKQAKQDAGQSVDHRAVKAENQQENAAARGGTAQRTPEQRNPDGSGPATQQRNQERSGPSNFSRSVESDRTEREQRPAHNAGAAAPQRSADVSRRKEGVASNEAPGLGPTPEFQQKLDEFRAHKEARQHVGHSVDHRAAKAENQLQKAEGGPSQRRPVDSGPGPPATRQTAAAAAAAEQKGLQQQSGAYDGTAVVRTPWQTEGRTTRPDEQHRSAGGNDRDPPGPSSEYTGPEPRQHKAEQFDPVHDLRRHGTDRDVPRTATHEPPRPGDRGFDPGEHRGELRDDFRPGCHDPEGRFDEKERSIADRLAQDGASVHPRERDDTVDDKKNPDSMVRTSPEDPGTVTEFKTLESASSNAVRQNILDAAKQVDQYGGGDAILDGRGVKLTDEDARRGYARAVGQARQMNLPMPDRVMIIIGDGSIKVFPEG